MKRYYQCALMIFGLSGMAGCSLVPDFPDLWPFDDDPVLGGGRPQLAAPLPAVVNEQATEVEATIRREPLGETAQFVPQLSLFPGDVGGAIASASGAVAYIIAPADGAVVTNPVRVLFGLDRMGVAPVTSAHEATGHHHLLIDTVLPPLDRQIPVDDKHRHFSGGQTETTLNLPVGEHTLQLLLGDHTHTPHKPPIVSQKISITVR